MKKIVILLLMIFFVTAENENRTDFNAYVLNSLKKYATNGSHKYYWPKSGGWAGNTKDLHYKNKLFSKGDDKKRCYCCGLTFEVFFDAYKAYCKDHGKDFDIKGFDHKKLKKFRGQWFGSDGNRRTLQNAIVSNKLGKAIKMEEAKPGDFVQLWRHKGSGHSVVFIGWLRDTKGKISGIEYWSTQTSTNGIHYNKEYFGTKGLKRDETYIARVIVK